MNHALVEVVRNIKSAAEGKEYMTSSFVFTIAADPKVSAAYLHILN